MAMSSWTTISETVTERLSSRCLSFSKPAPSPSKQPQRFTLHGLKSHLEAEVKNSREINLDLIEAVFPDDSLPFEINAALVRHLQSLPASRPGRARKSSTCKSQAKPAPRSKLTQPPSDWSEESIANWLNSIGAALEMIYTEINDKPIGSYWDARGNETISQRRTWSHAQKHKTLRGSEILRKPDLILLNQNSVTRTWQKVHALCEVTCSPRAKNRTLKDTVLQKSYITLALQSNRTFIPCLDIANDTFKFSVIDRTGLVTSNVMKIKQNFIVLLRIIVGLMFARPSVIGYDETIKCNVNGKAVSIMVGGEEYNVEEELFRSDALKGRATRCWRVSRMEEQGIREKFVVKDSWVDTRRTRSEIVTLRLIEARGLCKGGGVPKLIHGEDVPLYGGTGSEPISTKDSTARRRVPSGKVEERVHRRLLMGPVGMRIIDFKNLKELVGAFVNVVEGNIPSHIINRAC
jgi:hypothetical protein